MEFCAVEPHLSLPVLTCFSASWIQVELEGAGHDTLRAAGICSGDTLWLLAPSDQKDAHSSAVESVKPYIATSSSSAATRDPLGSAQTHETEATPSEASVQLPDLQGYEDGAMQCPTQVSCSNNAARYTILQSLP